MKRSEVDKSKLSPMMLKYLEIKEKYNDTIIFYRLGDFYEMFFEDAILCSRELELTLTGRNAGLDERVPMCGIPHHAYLSYLEKLKEAMYEMDIDSMDENMKKLEEYRYAQEVQKSMEKLSVLVTNMDSDEAVLLIEKIRKELK